MSVEIVGGVRGTALGGGALGPSTNGGARGRSRLATKFVPSPLSANTFAFPASTSDAFASSAYTGKLAFADPAVAACAFTTFTLDAFSFTASGDGRSRACRPGDERFTFTDPALGACALAAFSLDAFALADDLTVRLAPACTRPLMSSYPQAAAFPVTRLCRTPKLDRPDAAPHKSV